MENHPSLTEETVNKKIDRLIASLQALSYAHGFRKAQYNKKWVKNGWHDFVSEDFHFAYEVKYDEHGNEMVVVQDAIHSLLYH